MAEPTFALGAFRRDAWAPFAGLVLGERAFDLREIERLWGRGRAGAVALDLREGLMGLLADWDRSFDALRELAAFIGAESVPGGVWAGGLGGMALDRLTPLPPIPRPSKILNCAANYSGHLAEMGAYTQSVGTLDKAALYRGDKTSAEPYLFLKAPSSLIGARDDIVIPGSSTQLDWEAELGVVIGPMTRHVKAERAAERIAGYITFNDISARDQLWRADRPNFRSDWLSSKSHDTFGPSGPLLVPRQFVPEPGALRISLSVNGEAKQDGLAGDMIFSPEEQIEYASARMSLLPGDLLATGTLAGVGQASGVFLKVGDIVEARVEGLGAQRNRVVAAPTSDQQDHP